MKKKLLLAILMVAMLACIFTVAASAAEIPEWTEITEVDGMPDKSAFGVDGTKGATSRVLMADGVTYPAYYICKNSTTLGISFSDINSKAGKAYASKDVIRIEIPVGTTIVSDALKVANGYTALVTVVIPEGATKINDYGFKAANASTHSPIVSITIPSTVNSIGLQAFAFCNSLEELIIPEGVSVIPKEMVRNATSLNSLTLPSTIVSIGEAAFRSANISSAVVIPEGCTKIESYAFKGSNVTSVTIPSTIETLGTEVFMGCPVLTDVYCKSPIIGEKMFNECVELKNVKLENTVEIKHRAFNNSTLSKIESLELPEGLTTMGDYVLPRSSLISLVLPSTLTTIGSGAFQTSKTLKKVVALNSCFGTDMFKDCSAMNELVLTESFVTFGSNAMSSVSQASFITYYTGTDYDRIKSVCSATTRLSQAKYYSYADYENGNYTSNKFMVIYDTNLCVAGFGGIHSESIDDGDCTTPLLCARCALSLEAANEAHNYGIVIEYANGYLNKGVKKDGCTRCNAFTTEDTEPLFTLLGYSAPKYGDGGIAIGYTVDKDAMAEYEDVTGKTFKYGVFAASQNRLGNNDVFGKDGTAADGVINADLSNQKFSAFELKVTGFTDDKKDTKLALGAYVYVIDGDTIEYSYIQYGTPNEGEKYVFNSFNEIVAICAAKE